MFESRFYASDPSSNLNHFLYSPSPELKNFPGSNGGQIDSTPKSEPNLRDWAKSKLFLIARLAHIILLKEKMSSRDIVLIVQVRYTCDNEYTLERFYLCQLRNIKKILADEIVYDSLKHSFHIGPVFENRENVKAFVHDTHYCCSISVRRRFVGTQSEKKRCDEELLQQSAMLRLKQLQNQLHNKKESIEMIKIGDVEMAIERPSGNTELIPSQMFSDLINNQEILSHLRWMIQKGNLRQDMFLMGPPGPLRRNLALMYAQLRQIEVEYVSISRDITESDFKQRKEIVNGTAIYKDQACVRAAIHGRLLILDGVEKAERNVLPIINNLLENREMALEDGRFLMHHSKFDEVSNMGSKFVRTSEKFLVIALGLPTPKYDGFSLDPPFRSRFQARFIELPTIESQLNQYHFLKNTGFDLILQAQHILQDFNTDQGARIPDFPVYLDRFASLLAALPGLHPRDSLVLLYPFLEFSNADPQMVNIVNSVFDKLHLSKTESTNRSCVLLEINSISDTPIRKIARMQVENSVTKQIKMLSLPVPSGLVASTRLLSFIETKYHSRCISLMFQAHAVGDICIIGEKGSGKSIMARHFAHLLGYNIEFIPLYRDMSCRDILQRRCTDSKGDTMWENSGLVKAAIEGSIALLDPIDVLPLGTLGSLQRLILEREIVLPDGSQLINFERYQHLIKAKGYTREMLLEKRIFMIHQSFRIIALARPKPFTARGKWLNPEILSMFSFLPIRPMNIEEEETVLHTLFPSLGADQIQAIAEFAQSLRSEKDETIQEVARNFSTRQLIRIAKRLVKFPNEDLFSTIMKISLFKFLPNLARDTLTNFLSKHNIKESKEAEESISISHFKTDRGNLCLKIGNVTAETFENTQATTCLIPKVLFYENQRQNKILLDVLKDFLLGEHLLLIGNQGVGKNKIVDYFLQLMKLPRKYIQLHRDTTVFNLTSTPILVNGRLEYDDSPLVEAVKEGYILVVDEVDKAPTHVTSILKSLVEDKEMVLADGRKITGSNGFDNAANAANTANEIRIHQNFRMICLANRPGFPFLGNDFYREIGDVFACHCIDNPDPQSELELLLNYGPDIREDVLLKLIAAFTDLRKLAEAGLINYPYSTRELVNVVKHYKSNPGDGIGRALRNVFDFDTNSDSKDIIRDCMSKNGLPSNLESNFRVALGESIPFENDPIIIERWNFNSSHSIEVPLHFEDVIVRGKWPIVVPKEWSVLEQINGRAAVFSELLYSFNLFSSGTSVSDMILASDKHIYAISTSPVKMQIISPNHRMQKVVPLHEFIPSTQITILSLFEIGIGKIAIHNSQEHNFVILDLLAGNVSTVLIKGLDPALDSICSEKANGIQFLYQIKSKSFVILDLNDLKQAIVCVLDLSGISSIQVLKNHQWLIHDSKRINYSVTVSSKKLGLDAINESELLLANFSAVENDFWTHSYPSNFYGLILKPSDKEWILYGWPRQKDNFKKNDNLNISSGILRQSCQFTNVIPISSLSECLLEFFDPTSKVLYRTSIRLPLPNSDNRLCAANVSYSEPSTKECAKKILELGEGDKILILSTSGECFVYQCIQDSIMKDLKEWKSLTGSMDEKTLTLQYKGEKIKEISAIIEESNDVFNKYGHGKKGQSGTSDDMDRESGTGNGIGVAGKIKSRESGTIDNSFQLREMGEISQITNLQKELHHLEFQEKLKRLQMTEKEYLRFVKYRENVAKEIRELKAILEAVEAKNTERIWKKNQISGEIDDDKLIEGLAGERSVYRVRGENEDNFFQTVPKQMYFVFDLSASMLRFNGHDGRMDRSLECALMLMESFKGFEHKFKYKLFGHSGDGPALNLNPDDSFPQNEKDYFNILNRMLTHAQYTISGDNTLAAITTAVKGITLDEGDDYFVLVLSDANLHQYNITSQSLNAAMQADSRVNTCLLFIGNISNQADRISSDLNGQSYNCFDNAKLPKIIKNMISKSIIT